MRFDMHVHTSFSDGLLNPEDVVDLAIKKNLDGIAITDHDSVNGIESALKQSKKYPFFNVIPGIELGCIYNNEEVHILGYFIDYSNDKLKHVVNKLSNSRLDRAVKIIELLQDLGVDITMNDVKEQCSNENLGRPHIARALIKKNYALSIQDAFDKYIGIGKPAYVDRFQLTIVDTINLIKSIGGISILAHPGLLKNKDIINYCIINGIDGIECIHSMHSIDDEEIFKNIAQINQLIITGGSDYHGDRGVLGECYIDISTIPYMKERLLNV